VLRLYLAFPEAAKPGCVAACLQLALRRLPQPDFRLCLHLVPERASAEPEVAQLTQLASHLEACRFADFWAALGGLQASAASLSALTAAARAYAAGCLSGVYRDVSSKHACETLGLSEEALAQWAQTQPGWSLAGGVLACPETEQNSPVPACGREQVPLAKLAALLSSGGA
jgi:translation initiation factor 3 subunit K